MEYQFAGGGELLTEEGQKGIRIVGEFQSVEDVENLVIRANERGKGLLLKEVATVTQTLAETKINHDVSGQNALSMLVLKKSDADIIDVVDEIRTYLDTVPDKYGEDVTIQTFTDFSKFARMRLGVLTNNGVVGLILVFISLFIFLRPSVAFTTTMGLPIVFFAGLFVLYASGVTLNLISMLGFIMVLGMLVDDAIIIGENITYHMEKGLTPAQAAVKGTVELIGPVTATVLTTVIAFLPLAYMSGIIGKFIFAIPVVVIVLLLFSLWEAFFILPSHVAHFTNASSHPKERVWILWLENIYAWFLRIALKIRWLSVIILFGIFGFSIWLAQGMNFSLFPAAGVDQALIRVTDKPGISLPEMRQKMKAVDAFVRSEIDEKYLEATIITSGEISADQGDPLTQRGSRFGQIRLLYIPALQREEHEALDDVNRLSDLLPEKFPDLYFSLTEVKPGPPTGRALQAELSSSNPKDSEEAARRLISYLNTIEGVNNVESGLQEGDEELHVVFDRALAAYAGVDLQTASSLIRAAVDGLRVSTTRRGTEEVDITIRYPEDEGKQMEYLLALRIPNQRGGLVPLDQIAKFVEKPGPTTIRHKDGTRIVNVVGNIDESVITSQKLNQLVRENEKQWLGDLEPLVEINYGGEEEKNQESVIGLAVSFLFAMVGIFFILAIQFNRLSYPLLVMAAIPYGASGVIFSFYLHDLFWKPTPLSFFALMGVVALAGVVVNNSLVLLVFVQRARQKGMAMLDALIEAGRRRLRAVILTSTTTVVGLLPTAYGWGGSDPFVAPMALALSWGLVFSTFITLIGIPVFYGVAHDLRIFFGWVGKGLVKALSILFFPLIFVLRLLRIVPKAEDKDKKDSQKVNPLSEETLPEQDVLSSADPEKTEKA